MESVVLLTQAYRPLEERVRTFQCRNLRNIVQDASKKTCLVSLGMKYNQLQEAVQ